MNKIILNKLDDLVLANRNKRLTRPKKPAKELDTWSDVFIKYYPHHIKPKVKRKEIIILEAILNKINKDTSVDGNEFLNYSVENWGSLGYTSSTPNLLEFCKTYVEKVNYFVSLKQSTKKDSLRNVRR